MTIGYDEQPEPIQDSIFHDMKKVVAILEKAKEAMAILEKVPEAIRTLELTKKEILDVFSRTLPDSEDEYYHWKAMQEMQEAIDNYEENFAPYITDC